MGGGKGTDSESCYYDRRLRKRVRMAKPPSRAGTFVSGMTVRVTKLVALVVSLR